MTGTGTIAVSLTPGERVADAHNFQVKITTSGNLGAGGWSWSMDGGSFVAAGVLVATYDLPGGTRLKFANGSGSPSFVLNDVYQLQSQRLTLAALLAPQNQDDIRQPLKTGLAGAGFPVEDWPATSAGGVENGTIDMAAGAMADMVGAKVAAWAGGLLEKVTGDLLTLVAKRLYQVDRALATKTVQTISLACVPDAGPYPIKALDMWFLAESGNRYVNLDEGTLKAGDGIIPTLVIRIQAEEAGAAYADPPGTINHMVTTLAGVTAVNTPVFTPAQVIRGDSTGTITPKATIDGQIPTETRYRIEIVQAGPVGGAIFIWSVDDGLTWSDPQIVPGTTFALGTSGTSVDFGNGPSATGTPFKAGDVFAFASTSIVELGSDEESDERLRARCRGRWPALSDVPTPGAVALWAQLASPEIQRVRVKADNVQAGRMIVYVGGSSGPPGLDAEIAVERFIADRLGFQEYLAVRAMGTFGILPGGNVYVEAARQEDVQAAAQLNWLKYLEGLDTGAVVRISELEQAIMDAGAVDCDQLTLNGDTFNIQLGMADMAVPADGSTLATALTWGEP